MLASFFPPSKETTQLIALNSIQDFWGLSEWHVVLYIQTFLEYKLLKPNIAINWVFKNLDKIPGKPYEDWVYWYILENILDRGLAKSLFLANEIKKDLEILASLEKEGEKAIKEESKGKSNELKKDDLLKTTSENEIILKQTKEDLKSSFLLIFKKLCLLMTDCSQNNRSRYDTVIERFLGFFRKYRKEIEPFFEKLEEDFYLLSSLPDIQKIIVYFKLLL